MERQQNQHHRRHMSATLSRNFSKVHSFVNRTAHDDAFTAPINAGAQGFSPRFADYTEVFSSSKASRGSSIPLLDLPPLMDTDSTGGVQLDYSSIFGGFTDSNFGVSYEELFPGSMGDDTPASSLDSPNLNGLWSVGRDQDSTNTPPTTADPSDDRQFNMSFNKSSNKTGDGSVSDVETHITQLYATPGFTRIIDGSRDTQEMNCESNKPYLEDPIETTNDRDVCIKAVSNSPPHRAEVVTENTEKFNNESSQYDFMKPGSSHPESSEEDTSQDRFDCCTETFSDEEINCDSAAAASAAAVRVAIKEAGELIRLVKVSLKNRNGSGVDSKFSFMAGSLNIDGEEDNAATLPSFNECQPSGETAADPESRGETRDADLHDFRETEYLSSEITGKSETSDEWQGLKQLYQLMNICKKRAVSLFSDRTNTKSFAGDELVRRPPMVHPVRDDPCENSAIFHQTVKTAQDPSVSTSYDGLQLNEPPKAAKMAEKPSSENADEVADYVGVRTGWENDEKELETVCEEGRFGNSSRACRADGNGEKLNVIPEERFHEEPLVDCGSNSEETFEKGELSERKNVDASDSDEPFEDIDGDSEFLEESFIPEIREMKSESMNEIFGRDSIPQIESQFTMLLQTEVEGDDPIDSGFHNVETNTESDSRCEDGRLFEMESKVSTEAAVFGDRIEAKVEGDEFEKEMHEKEEEENSSCQNSYDNSGSESVVSCDFDEQEETINQESFLSDDLNGDADYAKEDVECIENAIRNEGNQTEEPHMSYEHKETIGDVVESQSGENSYESDETVSTVDYEEETVVEPMKLQSMDGEFEILEDTRCSQSTNKSDDDTLLLEKSEAEKVVHKEEHSDGRSISESDEKLKEKVDRKAVERVMTEARERAYVEAREKAERLAVERAKAEYVEAINKLIRERLGKANAKSAPTGVASEEAKRRSERAAVERATEEARERALQKALSEKTLSERRLRPETPGTVKDERSEGLDPSRNVGASNGNSSFGIKGEFILRNQAKLERHQRTVERVAKALEEKNTRDLLAQKEQAEKNRLADTVGTEVKRWAKGKQGNLRALLSTLQYILGPDSGWQPIPLTDLVAAASVKKAYRKATLFVHPDKLQQRGATVQQKYVCEKVFDLLKDAWNRSRAD